MKEHETSCFALLGTTCFAIAITIASERESKRERERERERKILLIIYMMNIRMALELNCRAEQFWSALKSPTGKSKPLWESHI